VSDWKQSAAGLIMEINFQQLWYVSRCCGTKFSGKSDAYVSTQREVRQPKFIADFFCKALISVKKSIAVVYTFRRGEKY